MPKKDKKQIVASSEQRPDVDLSRQSDGSILTMSAVRSKAPGAFDFSRVANSKFLTPKLKVEMAALRSSLSIFFFSAEQIESYGQNKKVNDQMVHLAKVEFSLFFQLLEEQRFKFIEFAVKGMLISNPITFYKKIEMLLLIDQHMVFGITTEIEKVDLAQLNVETLTTKFNKLKQVNSIESLMQHYSGEQIEGKDPDATTLEKIKEILGPKQGDKKFEEFLMFCISMYKKVYEPYFEIIKQHRLEYTAERRKIDVAEVYSEADFALYRSAILERTKCVSWFEKAKLMAIRHDLPMYRELKEPFQRLYLTTIKEMNKKAYPIDDERKEKFLQRLQLFISDKGHSSSWVNIRHFFSDLNLSRETIEEYAKEAFSVEPGMTVNQYCIERIFQFSEKKSGLKVDLTRQSRIPQEYRFITRAKKKKVARELTRFAKQTGLFEKFLSVAEYNQQQEETYLDSLHTINDLLKAYLKLGATAIGRAELVEKIGELKDVLRLAGRKGVSVNQYILQEFSKHYQHSIDMTKFGRKNFSQILKIFMQQLEQREIHIELFEDDIDTVDDYRKTLHLRMVRAIYPYLCQIGLSIGQYVNMTSSEDVSAMYDELCKRAQREGFPVEELIIPFFLDLAQEKYIAVDFSKLPKNISQEFSACLRSILNYEIDQWTAAENCDIYYFIEEQLRYWFDSEFSGYTPFAQFIADYKIRHQKTNLEKVENARRAHAVPDGLADKQGNALVLFAVKQQQLAIVTNADGTMKSDKKREITVEQRGFLYSREEELKTDFIKEAYGKETYDSHNPDEFILEEEKITAKQQALVRCEELLFSNKDSWSVEDFVAFHAAAKCLLNPLRNETWDNIVKKSQAKTWKAFLPTLQAAMLAAVEHENQQLKVSGSIDARRAMLDFVGDLELFAGNKKAETKLEELVSNLPYPVSSDAFQQNLTAFKAGPLKEVDLVTQRKGLPKEFEAFTGAFTTIKEFVSFFDAIGYRHDGKTAGEDTDGLTLLRKENRSASAWGGQFGHTKTSQCIAEKAIEQLKTLLEAKNFQVTPAQDAMCRYVLTMKIARGLGNKKAKANLKWYEDKVKVVENPDVQAESVSEERKALASALV